MSSVTASAPTPTEPEDAETLDIENLFPADPDIMVSPEGDMRGLNELKAEARDRRDRLGIK